RCAEGRVRPLPRYRPPGGQRLLESPSRRLAAGEPAAQAAQRLLALLLGPNGTGAGPAIAAPWEPLGQLRPNPGYSDEQMALGLVRLAPRQVPLPNDTASEQASMLAGDDGSTGQLLSLSPAALDALLASGDEPLDGRTLTAWFLARCRW
ncbi:MAG: hypothetical protein ACK535_00560, partial [Cyanobacteriota bacterium]